MGRAHWPVRVNTILTQHSLNQKPGGCGTLINTDLHESRDPHRTGMGIAPHLILDSCESVEISVPISGFPKNWCDTTSETALCVSPVDFDPLPMMIDDGRSWPASNGDDS